LKNNGLHIEIQFDPRSPAGKTDSAGISDVIVEAAITAIMDCEDSVAAVDAQDKLATYRNWLGLMQGSLTSSFQKDSRLFTRSLNANRVYKTPANSRYELSGRCLLFNRNVGLLMTTSLAHDPAGMPVPEHIVDALVTCLGSMIDFNMSTGYRNSNHGSIYIVKPKLHGPDEVRFTCDLFDAIETQLRLPAHTIKLGIMDEERRTSVNLKQCIDLAKQRLVFINTGFLDRTGDEISTSMKAGAFSPKEKIKLQPWIQGYANQNVDVGLACGLSGKAQIGKGM
jgi:malate synthase